MTLNYHLHVSRFTWISLDFIDVYVFLIIPTKPMGNLCFEPWRLTTAATAASGCGDLAKGGRWQWLIDAGVIAVRWSMANGSPHGAPNPPITAQMTKMGPQIKKTMPKSKKSVPQNDNFGTNVRSIGQAAG